jgi:hypothetical protein
VRVQATTVLLETLRVSHVPIKGTVDHVPQILGDHRHVAAGTLAFLAKTLAQVVLGRQCRQNLLDGFDPMIEILDPMIEVLDPMIEILDPMIETFDPMIDILDLKVEIFDLKVEILDLTVETPEQRNGF